MVGARSVLGAASVMRFESGAPTGGRRSAERGGHTVGGTQWGAASQAWGGWEAGSTSTLESGGSC